MGEESFDVTVCSPEWLAERCREQGFVVGRHHLVVDEFNVGAVLDTLSKLVQNCHGETWQEVAEQVSRIGYWEFEDYRE